MPKGEGATVKPKMTRFPQTGKRAERKLGEILKASDRNKGGQPMQKKSTCSKSEQVGPPSLPELGIDRKVAARAQALADAPEPARAGSKPPPEPRLLALRFIFSRRPRHASTEDPADELWRIEAVDERDVDLYPLGVAYVNVYANVVDATGSRLPMLQFVQVADHCRRRGVGLALLKACRHRWPNIEFGTAISPEGERLLKAAQREGVTA